MSEEMIRPRDAGGRRTPTSGPFTRRDLLRRSAAVGAGAAALPLLARSARSVAAQDIPRAECGAEVNGTLRILLKDDFHPDHNAFMRAELEAFADAQGWPLEITDIAGYQGGGDLYQKLLGSVQAGDPPDLVVHDESVLNMHTLGLLEPVTELVDELIELHGDPNPGMRFDAAFEDAWWAVPFFTRANGLWARQDVFAEHGLDVIEDTRTYDQMRESALAMSDHAANMWGWGMTVNRSGDGNGLVQGVIFRYGGHLQDESGQLVTFDSPETVAGLEWLKETYTGEEWAPMLPPGVLSWTDPSNNEAFLAGQTAITQNAGTVYAKAVLDGVPFADQIAFIPNPVRITDDVRLDFLAGGMTFRLIKGSKNREAASCLMGHFLTPPVQERIFSISTGYALPAYEAGWDNPVITADANSMRAREMILADTGFTGLNWPGPNTSAVASIASSTAFTDMMSEVLQGRPVEEVVSDYHQRFVQIYQDFGFEGE